MSFGQVPKRSVADFLLWVLVFVMLTFCAVIPSLNFSPDLWYEALEKPGWTPPDYVFPIVWT